MNSRTKKYISLLGTVIFAVYLAALVYFLFFAEQYGRTGGDYAAGMNLVPLREIRRFWQYRELLGSKIVLLNLAGNVIGFMPFGLVLPLMHRHLRHFWSTVGITMGFSICVEVLQFFTRTGSCDIDDIILNTLGGILGYMLFALCNTVRKHMYE